LPANSSATTFPLMSRPKSAQALQAAIVHHQAGRLPAAIAIYREIVAAERNNPDATHLLALALHQAGDDAQAIPLFNRALMLGPTTPAYAANFAELWRKQGSWPNATECYRKVLRLEPGNQQIRQLLGEALNRLEKFAEAESEFRVMARARPGNANAWVGLAEALRRGGKLDESVEAARRGVAVYPNHADALHALGWGLIRQGRPAEGLAFIDQAIRVRPSAAKLRWHRAWGRLLMGDYARGWADYEARWEDPELQQRFRRPFAQPQWHGENADGKTVLIHAEQGLGDTIQFVRYAPLLAGRGTKVVIEAQPELAALFRRSMPAIDVIEAGQPLPSFDFHVPMLSLPLAFGTTLQTIPNNVPYLTADEPATLAWRQRLADLPGLKVGLVWAGRPTHRNDANRSVRLDRLAPLAQIPGVSFVSLQLGEASQQIQSSPAGMNSFDASPGMTDFDSTAGLVSALDLVIAVDTAIIHLCGALGRPAWALIQFDPDFRWMLGREDTPWYPSVRLFRQPKFGDWDAVAKMAAGELANVTASSRH
jgi:tetratricopeptide (TPR) repeat protein